MSKFKILLLCVLTILVHFNAFSQKQLTRKEHLTTLDKHYFLLSDHLWDYISHVANGEKISKLDKKRRGLAKSYYEEKKKIETVGDYKGNKVIYDALLIYVEACKNIIQNEYKDLSALEDESHKSPEALDAFLKELYKVNTELSTITNQYNGINIAYRKKYFSYSKYKSKKDGKSERIPENKIISILKVFDHYTPVYVQFLHSEALEQNIFDLFEKDDTLGVETLTEELNLLNSNNWDLIRNSLLYLKDTNLLGEFKKVLRFQENGGKQPDPLFFFLPKKSTSV